MPTHDEVLGWIEEQTAAYLRMMEIARQQATIEESNTTDLIEMVTRKAKVMETVEGLEKRLGPIKQQWSEFLAQVPESRREPLREAMKTLRNRLGELVELETDQQNRLQQNMDVLSKEIQHTLQGQRAGKAYQGQSPPPPSRFMDRKG